MEMKKDTTKKQRRPVYRTVLYGTAVVVGIAALIAVLYVSTLNTGNTASVNTNATARDTFDALYQVSLRYDGSAGNTAVDVVYYYPALSQSLKDYADRTQLEAGTLAELEQYSATGLFPFAVTLQHNEAFDASFDPKPHMTLKADGATVYELERWQTLSTGDVPGNNIVGVAWFKQPDGAPDVTSFTLTFKDLPGNTKETSFSWNASLLTAVQ